MRTVYFTLPRMTFSLESTEEIVEVVTLFYPFYMRTERPEDVAHTYRIEKEGEEWVLSKNGQVLVRMQGELEAVFSLEYDVEISVLQHRKDWLAFHAGCVAVGDKACIIAGNPDTGKTTTTFNLVEMGHKFMCEEIAFLDTESGEVLPYLQTPSLDKEFIKVVKERFPVKRGEISPTGLFSVRYRPQLIQKEPMELSTIVVPRRDPDAQPEIIPLKPGEFLTEFLSYCFEPNVDMENFLDNVITVLEKTQIVRLVYRDILDCREGLRQLFPLTSA
ncbi:hypothetical protein ACFLT2_10920 [Acidobacteriota bacterium]